MSNDSPELTPAQFPVLKKLGGRHLVFQTPQKHSGSSWNLVPTPYAMISNFNGPVWFFFGLGQVWLTHQKSRQYDGWTARVSRLGYKKITRLLEALETPITDFTHYCNVNGLEGTIVIDEDSIEFHWTFGYELKQEKQKPEKKSCIENQFDELAKAFLKASSSMPNH